VVILFAVYMVDRLVCGDQWGRRRRRLGSTTSEVSLFTVQWEPVSRLSPGEAMAMAMALAAQQWRRRGGG
jgi:hypothetical protein